MIVESGNSLQETKRRNRILIKNKIFRMEHALRNEIARELGLTLPTITNSINEMIREGLVITEPLSQESRNKNSGRRPLAVAFRREAAYAIGIELGPYYSRAILVNLRGEAVESVTNPKASESYGKMLSELENLVEHFLHRIDRDQLIGIGIGVPGFVDTDRGRIRYTFREDWNGKTLGEDLGRRFSVPVSVDNNTRLRATGYEMLLREERPGMFAYFFVSRGIACPILMNDLVLSGDSAGAGELGQTVLLSSDHEGRKRTVTTDQLASESALFELCRREMAEGRLAALRKRLDAGEELTMRLILELQMEEDQEIDALIDGCIHGQALAMANVVNLLNPNAVVVDAYMMTWKTNRERLVAYAREHFFGMNEKDVEIRFREYDSYDGALGAALGCIQKNFLNI